VDGTAEVRSTSDGRFVARDVPTGTRQIEVLALGMSPVTATADVTPGDTVNVALELHRIVTLDSVHVKAPLSMRQILVSDIAERRKEGFGHFRDSTEIGKYPTLSEALSGMPGVQARGSLARTIVTMNRGCLANVWLDGVHVSGQIQLTDLFPDQIADIEVYTRPLSAPPQFVIRSGPGAGCGSIVVWTKRIVP
jgi:hypothetical protein